MMSGLVHSPDELYDTLAMAVTTKKKALRLIEKQGIVRSRDLEAHGISRTLLARLVEDQLVVREARGLYVTARHETVGVTYPGPSGQARSGGGLLPADSAPIP